MFLMAILTLAGMVFSTSQQKRAEQFQQEMLAKQETLAKDEKKDFQKRQLKETMMGSRVDIEKDLFKPNESIKDEIGNNQNRDPVGSKSDTGTYKHKSIYTGRTQKERRR